MVRVLLFVIAIFCSFSVPAEQMSIKLLNQSGQAIKTEKVWWGAAGNPRPNICFWETNLGDGGFTHRVCDKQPNVDRWKRKIFVRFYCVDDVTFHEVKYPRNKSFYDRDYLVDKDGVYTIRVFASDC